VYFVVFYIFSSVAKDNGTQVTVEEMEEPETLKALNLAYEESEKQQVIFRFYLFPLLIYFVLASIAATNGG
jgi:hypothetical protein